MPSKATEGLPDDNEGYGTRKYWEHRYTSEKQGTTFDWFLTPEYLLPFVSDLYPSKESRVLMLGCGNSRLSEVMYDAGYQNIVNVDYSSTVIQDMSARHISRPQMTWYEMDVLNLQLEDGSFDLVIDKGTMDAMLTSKGDPWNPPQKDVDACTKEVDEALRVLKHSPGSKFLYFTFGQPHFRKRYMINRPDWTFTYREIGPPEGLAYFLYVLEYASS
ncbi:hypothetical protein TREMEDRAFT_37747 [Tremella mesenterica DSM 1558]|uniref:uncharacterized protein n=1 Tax=Tremella mesenterica (strain ATCC 24925 / CBS 8224 / DSM 1558 / NBRC 9311 / NRRL Y-6157 / RJB 2259-6 / UBC 559-6) TaxID=578456 RepID=UPI0003F4A1A7|nr:uncharacterized protein TREMEDRAFT_37747 [Tremella mesenterica DSM 1558]EIW71333.1 hypothetical protein TREMEDRAFT_37747 [Tremella mesenterica DSM 1558]